MHVCAPHSHGQVLLSLLLLLLLLWMLLCLLLLQGLKKWKRL
jgi:hypothetical protein